MSKRIQWFARGEGIKRMGPFATELEAWESLRGHEGDPIREAAVWPEEVKPETTKGSTR